MRRPRVRRIRERCGRWVVVDGVMSSVSSHRPGRLRGFGPGFQAFVCPIAGQEPSTGRASRCRCDERVRGGRSGGSRLRVDVPRRRRVLVVAGRAVRDPVAHVVAHRSARLRVDRRPQRHGVHSSRRPAARRRSDRACRRCRHERHVHRAIVPTGSIGRAGPHRVGGVDRAQLGGVRPHHGSRDPGAARELPSRRRSQRHRRCRSSCSVPERRSKRCSPSSPDSPTADSEEIRGAPLRGGTAIRSASSGLPSRQRRTP